jgi:4-hydroxybenzoate polyprenyltransferase
MANFFRIAVVAKNLWLACRPHQWIKNALVLVPFALAHRVEVVDAWVVRLCRQW